MSLAWINAQEGKRRETVYEAMKAVRRIIRENPVMFHGLNLLEIVEEDLTRKILQAGSI